MILGNFSSQVYIPNHLSEKKRFEVQGGYFLTDDPYYECSNFIIILRKKIHHVFHEKYNLNQYQNSLLLIRDLYLEFDTNFLPYLDGHFLILIWDKSKNRLFIGNNRHQATTLYTYQSDNSFIFATDLKNLLTHTHVKKNIYPPAIKSFLANGFTWSDNTQLENIKNLLPTFYILYQDKLTLHHHWKGELTFNKKEVIDIHHHLDQYESLYSQGISHFINCNQIQELGTLLSGGHDTSFALIKSSEIFNKPIHTFTVTFPQWGFSEESMAQKLASQYNANFHAIPFSKEHLDLIIPMIKASEVPVLGSTLPLFVLAKEAKKYVSHLLGGDGGDTMWGEYHPVGEVHRYIKHFPYPFRFLSYHVSSLLANLTSSERLFELSHVLSLFNKRDYLKSFMSRLCTYRHFSNDFQQKLLNPEIFGSNHYAKPLLEIEFTDKNFNEALIEGKLFNAFFTYQSFSQTKIFNSENIDFYLPTLYPPLKKFISDLPWPMVNGGTTFHRLTNSKKTNRLFHKMALKRHIPIQQIYNRSFDIPWYLYFNQRPHLLTNLKARLLRRGWYQDRFLNKLFSEFSQFKHNNNEILQLKEHGYRIACLLSLEVWALEFLDGRINQNFAGPLEDYLSI